MISRTLTAAMAVMLLTGASAKAETSVVFNNYLPEHNEIMRNVIRPWANAVEEASDGNIEIDFTASSLAPPPRQLEMIRAGVADAAMNISSFTASQWLAPLISELPVLFDRDSAKAHSIALWRAYEKFFREAEPIDGVHVVALVALTGNHIWNNKRPVEVAEDVSGLKLRVNPNGVPVIAAMGGVIVSRPAVDTFELVERGVVDGTVLPISSVEGLGVLEELKYATLYPGSLYRSTASIIFNQKVWDAMPEADRAAIEKVSGEALAALAGGNLDDATEQARAELEPAGMEVIEAGADQIAQLRQSEEVEAAIAKWKEKVAGLGLDPDEVISFYRAQLEELEN
ncbi:TRAP transporter substrate-binding protein DctP [Martelella mediterranea]|uniref:C4-dicarboxylate-binding periplasmic protein n=1 Tax=Martelella mediterranea DSM 17316 TaxID=1122214 RepID=A0A1U9Z895_9HYPH|nr:TRAP transporter substrate-binding protein DctP [Martelella mediterranea]AQZ53937.1 C4-dicarboxylate-binding periplasmic protein precursor [Martelella mediterranea DSM 17316]